MNLKKFMIICTIFLIAFSLFTVSYAAYSEPTYLVKYGSTGEGVKWVQSMLKQNGYTIDIDGQFGPKTKNAVIHFQKYNNLSQDGIVGPATRTALKKAVARINGSSTGSSSSTTTNKNTLPAFNRTSSNLLTIIKNCKTYYAKNNFSYNLAAGVRSIPADNSKSYNGNYYVDCSSYVSWVLYEYALANGKTDMKNYFSYQRNSATFASIGANGGNSYLKVVNGFSNAKAGDILVTPGHVEFLSSYTKNSNGTYTIKVYNCGSDSSIKVAGITNSATKNISEISYILRVK